MNIQYILYILLHKGAHSSKGGFWMFFQMAAKQSSKVKTIANSEMIDLYDRAQFIVSTLLKKELPSHNTMHHLLYTANIKLEKLRESISYHRKYIDLNTAIGTFHNEAYTHMLKDFNQLQLLIDSYITLNIEEERERINRRLRLMDDKVKSIHSQIEEFGKRNIPNSLEGNFWIAVKEDILPILAELR